MQVQIPKLVHDKIMHWIDKTNIEVSGFGKCTWHPKEQVLWIHDAHLVNQTGGAASTDLDANAMGKLMYETREQQGQLKWWWHSHVQMGVFWSSTDEATIKDLGQHDWCAATVFNQKREMRSAMGLKRQVQVVDFFNKGEPQTSVQIIDKIDTFIIDPSVTTAMRAAWDQEFERTVKERTAVIGASLREVDDERLWTTDESGFLHYKGRPTGSSDEKIDGRTKEGRVAKEAARQGYTERQLSMLRGGTTATVEESLDGLSLEDDGGLLGYGLIVEACALKMRPAELRRILDSKNAAIIADYDDKLTALEREGVFKDVPTRNTIPCAPYSPRTDDGLDA